MDFPELTTKQLPKYKDLITRDFEFSAIDGDRNITLKRYEAIKEEWREVEEVCLEPDGHAFTVRKPDVNLPPR